MGCRLNAFAHTSLQRHPAGMAALPGGYASLVQVAVDGVKDAFDAARCNTGCCNVRSGYQDIC